MKERLVDIIAITVDENNVGKLKEDCELYWRHGTMTFGTRMAVLYNPSAGQMEDIPLHLEGIGENARFGLVDILEELTLDHWNNFRKMS